jgi:hypothetical protein
MKIHPVAPGLLHADGRTDGQTDTTKPIFNFRNFVNASEKGYLQYPYVLKYHKKGLCNEIRLLNTDGGYFPTLPFSYKVSLF